MGSLNLSQEGSQRRIKRKKASINYTKQRKTSAVALDVLKRKRDSTHFMDSYRNVKRNKNATMGSAERNSSGGRNSAYRSPKYSSAKYS